MSVLYQGKEGLVGCLGGGCLKQLFVGSNGVGWMAWHGGDGQERGVTHALKCFSPLYNDEEAGGEKMTSLRQVFLEGSN